MTLLRSFAFLAFLNIGALIALYSSYYVLEGYNSETIIKKGDQYRAYQLATILRQDSNNLSRLSRVYANTGKERFARQYNEVLDISLGFVDRPKNYHRIYWDLMLKSDVRPTVHSEPISLLSLLQEESFRENEIDLFKKSKFMSNELAKIETSVFRDIKLLKIEFGLDEFDVSAWDNPEFAKRHGEINSTLYNEKYNNQLFQIAEPINGFYQAVEDRTAIELGSIAKLRERQRVITDIIIGFLVGTFIFSFIFIFLRIIKSAKSLGNSFSKLAAGDLDVAIPYVERSDEIGDMARSSELFKQSLVETTNQNWIKSHITELANQLQKSERIDEAATTVMDQLTPALSCVLGSFFYFNADYDLLQRIATYGVTKNSKTKRAFELGDGLVGQCAQSRKVMEIKAIPEGYGHVESGSGEKHVSFLYLVPIVQNDRLHGVLELGSFEELTLVELNLLTDVMPVLALYFENLTRASKTQGLLVRTQNQAEELRASEEELRSQSEEARASNEELRARTQQLAEKTSALQVSEEEMRVGNEELSEKTHILEERQIELSQAKKDAEKYAEEMKQANQYKSQFLANMSHELRTPLNSLLILARILSDNKQGNLNEDDIEAATIIHDSGQHLLHLINDILDLSKTEAGKTDVSPENIEVEQFLNIVKNSFDHLAKEKNVDFEINRELDAASVMFVDTTKVIQILNNLLSNAFKFTEKGAVNLNILTPSSEDILENKLPTDQKYIELSVSDSGIGMTDAQLGTVFTAFRQADGSTSRKYGGTGLGLTITKSLVELMGGCILANSIADVGSTFRVILPTHFHADLEKDSNDASPFMSDLEKKPKKPAETVPNVNLTTEDKDIYLAVKAGAKVSEYIPSAIEDDRDIVDDGSQVMLIIEDDKIFAKLLLKQVRERGFRGVVAVDPQSGLLLAKLLIPSGIVLDVNLPEKDGWQVLAELKSIDLLAPIPVHMLSALEDPGDAIDKGAIGYAEKAASLEAINEVLSRFENLQTKEDCKILLIEDDKASQIAIGKVLSQSNLSTISASSSREGIDVLRSEKIDCIILDLGLPDMNGFDFLALAEKDETFELPPVVIYSGRELSHSEIERLREYTDSVVIKGIRSAERLLSEVKLFLHSVEASLPEEKKAIITKVKDQDRKKTISTFKNTHVLLADDDMRNVFALSKVLKGFGCRVTIAKNGHVCLEKLQEENDISIVLMDMMMPGMDGMEAISHIRKMPKFIDLPIIAVTAKAMAGEREKCIAGGADDYLQKPVDIDALSDKMLALL